ncbi:ABC transporter permease [Candidatus Woesearchaeota archaeon]|nr:ABC transporter permease [Candidatus Woesearchaeota archaeon]
MITEYLWLSFENLRHKRLRSWLTMIGIVIGIAAIVSLIGLGEGLRAAIMAQFNIAGADVLRVSASSSAGPPGFSVVNPLTESDLHRIKNVNSVEAAVGRIFQSVTMTSNGQSVAGMMLSMPAGKDRTVMEEIFNFEADKGRLLKDGDRNAVVLGAHFFEEEHFDKQLRVGEKITIDGTSFTIIGFLEEKGSFFIDASIIANEEVMRSRYNRSDEYDFIGVKVAPGSDVNKLTEDIEYVMRQQRKVKKGEEDFSVESPQAIIKSLNNTLLGIQIFVYIIAGISLLVGGIGITNAMYTAVLERTKEIGIMKAVGAKNSTIFTLFFLEAGFLGSFGGFVGASLGTLMAYGAASISRVALGTDLISAHVEPWLFIGALLFSFLIGTLAGILPALQAAHKNPVDSLRYAK